MAVLNIIRALFTLQGTLSGYKTYIGLAATIMTVTAGFINSHILPWLNGTETLVALLNAAPGYVAAVTAAWALGAHRAALSSKQSS